MGSRLRALGRALLAVGAGIGACDGDGGRESPPGGVAPSESWLPSPPRQKDAWTPPSGALSAMTTSAIAALFEQGLADPRGLPYREIALRVRSVWGSEERFRTRGWVIDPSSAVAWSGLVVPIEDAGSPADLRADVERMIARDEEARARKE